MAGPGTISTVTSSSSAEARAAAAVLGGHLAIDDGRAAITYALDRALSDGPA